MKKIILLLFILNVLNAQAQNDLFVSSGVTFKIDGTTTVTLIDTKLTNNGTVAATAGSTLLVKGAATIANSSIAGTGTTTLANLTIDKSSNDAQIDQNIEIKGDLTLTTGNLKLNAGNITFTGSGQIVGETDAKRIYGTGGELITTLALNAPTNVNPANLGANITSTANLGSTTIKRGHTIYTVAGSNIARYYDINPTTNTGLDATLKFYYQDGELNGNAENNLVLWRSTDIGVSWTDRGKDAINTTTNVITLSAVDAFSRWTAAAVAALPIELLSFQGTAQKGYNLLTWQTASETNNKGFDIESSPNPSKGGEFAWRKIGFVAGNGTTNERQNYSFEDKIGFSFPSGEGRDGAYYRLKQLDFDGDFEYSKIVSITRKIGKFNFLSLSPNPTNDNINLVFENIKNDNYLIINVLDIFGRIVLSQNIETQKGINSTTLALNNLSAGTYFVQLYDGTESIVRKVIKE
jgi:hypothetical protein